MHLEWIKTKIHKGKYEISSHAEEERQADKISLTEIEKAILNGEILENYPKDPRGESCLILGYAEEGYPIHIVCGKIKSEKIRIITVYIPALPKWLDAKTRRR